MDQAKPDRRTVRTYTVAALLGLFVAAVVIAVISRMLPGGLSHLAKRALGQEPGGETGAE
jgi:hypothetical protein